RVCELTRGDLVGAAVWAGAVEMSATMAYEGRSPLVVLRSSAQMLGREPQLSPEGQEMAGFVVSETDRLNRLISTLLECARPRPPEFQLQDLHPIIRRAVELLAQRAERRRISIRTEIQPEPATLSCEREQR